MAQTQLKRHPWRAAIWGLMSADAERDLVFMPTSSPSPAFFGGTRPGNNDYADSIVALHGATGKVAWHFQTVHHDVWDYDNAAQPTLVELSKDGKPFPAVIQATKTGMLYIFHRETGEPFFPIEERPVPQGGVHRVEQVAGAGGRKADIAQPHPGGLEGRRGRLARRCAVIKIVPAGGSAQGRQYQHDPRQPPCASPCSPGLSHVSS